MFKKFFGRDDDSPRVLEEVSQLQTGDIISLKHRNELPEELQGSDLEVTDVNTYQYESFNSTEFTVKSAEDKVYFLSMEDDDGEKSLCFSIKIARTQVLTLFDEDNFSSLWDEDTFAELVVKQDKQPLSTWLADCYFQQTKYGKGYYYKKDCREEQLSEYVGEDGAEEFQYHDCEGSDDRFGLNVEVWADGNTDVFLQVYTYTDVIEQFHPHGN